MKKNIGICSVIDTYADENVLNESGKIDYDELKPVLFEKPTSWRVFA